MKYEYLSILIALVSFHSAYSNDVVFFSDSDKVGISEKQLIIKSKINDHGLDTMLEWNTKSTSYIKYRNGESRYIFKTKLQSKTWSNIEGSECELYINAYQYFTKSRKYESIWSMNSKDCDVKIDLSNSYLVTTNYGCCGAENVNTLYSVATSKKVISATGEIVRIPNTNLNLVYHSQNGVLPYSNDSLISGALFLLRGDSILDSTIIHSKSPPWTPVIKANYEEYFHKKEKPVTLEFDDDRFEFHIIGSRITKVNSSELFKNK